MKQEHVQSIPITGAVITVSTTRTKETDASGKTIQAILADAKIPVQHYAVVPDQIEAIRLELFQALKTCNCIIIDGGTGLTHDDCTIEAVTPLLEKKIDGFGELFRMKSYDEVGTSTMLSRAIAGTIRGRVVFCIPGSTPAVTLATKMLIVPEIPHILSHANK
jgi:molybdenum cofactor biosynthesis protein B